jgi:hypothetical protein
MKSKRHDELQEALEQGVAAGMGEKTTQAPREGTKSINISKRGFLNPGNTAGGGGLRGTGRGRKGGGR